MDCYETEAKKRFGKTSAYKEYEQKSKKYSEAQWQNVSDGLMEVFAKLAECKQGGRSADSDEAQELVRELQNYITENFYTCTNEILAGLGKMYTADERFKNNIDSYGVGTADFVSDAIELYVKGK